MKAGDQSVASKVAGFAAGKPRSRIPIPKLVESHNHPAFPRKPHALNLEPLIFHLEIFNPNPEPSDLSLAPSIFVTEPSREDLNTRPYNLDPNPKP
jgi:hypothetical protein